MKYSFKEIKRKIFILAAVIFVVAAGMIYVVKQSKYTAKTDDNSVVLSDEDAGSETDVSEESEVISETIVVHVCGAVNSPGVYELNADDRVADAVKAAGGFATNAAEDYLNLAETLKDGEKITVYTKKEVKKMAEADPGKSSENSGNAGDDTGSLVNINTATVEELMTLPGIGESKAKAIVTYREKNGPFTDVNDLTNISGIKEGVMSKIADSITVN